jgi:hypothetical protein
METRFRSSEFGWGDIMEEAWEIIRAGAASILPLAVVFALVNSIVLYISAGEDFTTGQNIDTTALGLQCVLSLVIFIMAVFATTAMLYLVEAIVKGQPENIPAALRYALSRLPQVLLVTFLVGASITIGMAFLIFPGIIIGAYLTFAVQTASLRKVGLPSIQYSIDLVQGHWWHVCLIMLGLVIPIGFISSFFSWMGGILAPAIGVGTIFVYFIGSAVLFLYSVTWAVFFLNTDYLAHPIEPAASIPEQSVTL